MKPDRARIRRRQEDGTVIETIVAFPSPEKALEFFNEFRRRHGVEIESDPRITQWLREDGHRKTA